MTVAEMEIQARADRDEIRRLKAEVEQAQAERDALREENNTLEHRFQSCPFCGEAGCECRAGEEKRGRERAEAALRKYGLAQLAESEAIRADQAIKRGIAEAERDTLRATLREIEQATEGIPEANCMLANRIARLALRDPAPAEELRGFVELGAPPEEPKP